MRVISAPYISPEIESFVSPATGKVINSRTQMQNDLARSGHILDEPGLAKDVARNKVYQQEKKFAPIATSIDATVTNLVNRGLIES